MMSTQQKSAWIGRSRNINRTEEILLVKMWTHAVVDAAHWSTSQVPLLSDLDKGCSSARGGGQGIPTIPE